MLCFFGIFLILFLICLFLACLLEILLSYLSMTLQNEKYYLVICFLIKILIDLYLYYVLYNFNHEQIKEIVFNFHTDNFYHVCIINFNIKNWDIKWFFYFWWNNQLCIGIVLCIFNSGQTNVQERSIG
jgi:hypothetical protein